MKNKCLLIIVLLFCAHDIQAQAFQWAKSFASVFSRGTDVVTDNDRNVISAGWYNNSVDLDPGLGVSLVTVTNPSSTLGSSSYLSKLDSNGQFIWGHTYNHNSRIQDVDVDNQGNILVVGHYRDSIDMDFSATTSWLYGNSFTNNSSYWGNIFIAKYDPNANLIWAKTIVNNSSVQNTYALSAHSLKVDLANNVILSGRFRDSVDFDPGVGVFSLISQSVSTSFNYGDKYLLKLDANGNFNWVRNWGNANNWGNNSSWYGSQELDVDANNNIFMPIEFRDSIDIDPLTPITTLYAQGLTDITLIKVSPLGNLQWHKEIGGANFEYCHSLATDPSGNIFYSIRSSSNPIDMDPGTGNYFVSWPTTNNYRKIILKLDNNGSFLWAMPNLDNGWGNSGWNDEGLATDTAGSLYLTTRIWPNSAWNNNMWDLDPGPNAYIVSSAGSTDIAFQNLDGNGQFIWGGVMGGPAADYSFGICTDNARGVYLVGQFRDSADFDPTPATSFLYDTPNSYDAFVVKLNNCNKSTSTVVQDCDSVLYNNMVYYQDTVFQSHYAAFNGCDSAHSIVIDVRQASHDTIVVDTCKFYAWNNTIYTSTGMYTLSFGGPAGCDSMATLNLTIDTGTVTQVSFSSCDSVVYNGIVYNQTGQYAQNYFTANQCDSDIIVDVIITQPDTLVSYAGTTSLLANASNATYSWIDCSTNQIVPGSSNSPNFTATQSGSYACVVTQNGCSDTSSCYEITVFSTGLENYILTNHLYPNPSNGLYHLRLNDKYNDVTLEIKSVSGQHIWSQKYEQLLETDLVLDEADGVYFLYLSCGDKRQVIKMLKH